MSCNFSFDAELNLLNISWQSLINGINSNAPQSIPSPSKRPAYISHSVRANVNTHITGSGQDPVTRQAQARHRLGTVLGRQSYLAFIGQLAIVPN